MDLSKYADMLSMVGMIAIGLPALLAALIAFFMLIPGEQPEKSLQWIKDKMQPVIDLIAKFSKK